MSSPAVNIIPGPDGGRIEFTIKGEPVALIDAEGLHVRGDVTYGGTLIDVGRASFDERRRNQGPDDEQ